MTNRREIDQLPNIKFRVKGSFDDAWLAYWFEGFVVTQQVAGETTLTGLVVDEAALHGLLAKIGNLGLELLFLERI
jgi:hypothetical protein